jgi:leucyl aminopeptidase
MWTIASLHGCIAPNSIYKLVNVPKAVSLAQFELGWGLAGYSFDAYKSKSVPSDDNKAPALVRLCAGEEARRVDAALCAIYMTRDLINVPAEDMGPANLAEAGEALAETFDGAKCSIVVGDDLLKAESYFPQVHTVGRAAAAGRAPRFIEIRWNETAKDGLVLVGKGVCYDTGGLSIKGTSNMLTMKKDMGGAAHALGLARMIMSTNLDVGL